MKKKKKTSRNRVAFVSASAATTYTDPYQTLSVHRGSSESEVKKAFRRLAWQIEFLGKLLKLQGCSGSVACLHCHWCYQVGFGCKVQYYFKLILQAPSKM